jgi:hypothetical protein
MPDPTLFHGIAVLIDDEIQDPNASVREIQKAIEEAGCHVVPLSGIPNDASVSNLHGVAFFVLDWNLYGTALREIADGESVVAPAGMVEENEASIVKFLRNLKKVRLAPVFIFTDGPVDRIKEKLKQHTDLYDETDPSHILVMDKREVAQAGVFNVLSNWMRAAPSVYVLKKWEKAYEKAKNELFEDFYVKGPLWPMILWKNYEDDRVPPAVLMGELIGRNLASRMTPFSCDLGVFADLLEGIKKAPSAYENVVRKVLEGERFLAEMRLDKDSFKPGDIFLADDGYRINIRPGCDCIPKGNDKLDNIDLYLLKGTVRPMEELSYDSKYGLIPEQDNEAVVFPVYEGKALCFKFRKLYTQKWRDLKENKRVGRLLPPFLTRLQQRYSSYLQRPGLSRLPNAAFHSPAPPVAPQAAIEALAATAVAELVPVQEVVVSQAPGETPTINKPPAEEPTMKAPASAPEAPKS